MSRFSAEYDLRPPRAQDEWSTYHAIRRRAIFEVYRPDIAYDPDYPDEYKPNHLSNVLVWRGDVIGTIRIDVFGRARVAYRFVAVQPELQGRGHGTVLLGLAEEVVCRLGRSEIILDSTAPALGFYRRNGFVEVAWPHAEPLEPDLVRVGKRL